MILETNIGHVFEIENAVATAYSNFTELVIKIVNFDNAQMVADEFKNANATKSIRVFDDNIVEDVIEPDKQFYGYTVLKEVRLKLDGGLLIVLKKPEA